MFYKIPNHFPRWCLFYFSPLWLGFAKPFPLIGKVVVSYFGFNFHFPVTNEIEDLVFTYFSYSHTSGDLHAQVVCSLCWDKDVSFLNSEFWTYILSSGFQFFLNFLFAVIFSMVCQVFWISYNCFLKSGGCLKFWISLNDIIVLRLIFHFLLE